MTPVRALALEDLRADLEHQEIVARALRQHLVPRHEPTPLRGESNVLVYLPLSYAIGGYTIAVPRDRVSTLDMNLEEAMRFTLTGGVTGLTPAELAKP